MKVFSLPAEIQAPALNFSEGMNAYNEREAACSAKLKAWLIEKGYTGSNTGEIYRIQHADSYAQYMVAEGAAGSRAFCLIHLPYMDAWNSPHAERVTKKDVLKAILWSKQMAAAFGRP